MSEFQLPCEAGFTMTKPTPFQSPVRRQIEAYRLSCDAWAADHAAAKACWAWEDTVAVGLKCGELLDRVTAAWRDRVFRGAEPAADGANELYRGLHELWLAVTDAVLGQVQSQLESDFVVDGAAELRAAAQRFRTALDAWQPPKISILVGLRDIELSAEAAANLDRILEEAKTNPPPTYAGTLVKDISTAEFLAATKRA